MFKFYKKSPSTCTLFFFFFFLLIGGIPHFYLYPGKKGKNLLRIFADLQLNHFLYFGFICDCNVIIVYPIIDCLTLSFSHAPNCKSEWSRPFKSASIWNFRMDHNLPFYENSITEAVFFFFNKKSLHKQNQFQCTL